MTGDEIGAGGAVGGGQSSKQTPNPKRACGAARRPLIQHDAATIEHDAHVKAANRAGALTSDDGAPTRHMVGAIIRAACRASGRVPREITGQIRTWPITHWRLAAYAVARDEGWSYTYIARMFSGRDHATIIYGVRRAHERHADKIAAIRAAL